LGAIEEQKENCNDYVVYHYKLTNLAEDYLKNVKLSLIKKGKIEVALGKLIKKYKHTPIRELKENAYKHI